MNTTLKQKDYAMLVKKKTPPSALFKDMCLSFVVGGLICATGQIINSLIQSYDISDEEVSSLTSAVMIFIGGLLTGFGLYDNIARYGKAGTLVPITGFANSIVSPAMEYKSEGLIMGVGAKMFVIAGPVLVYGISSSVLCGILYYLIYM